MPDTLGATPEISEKSISPDMEDVHHETIYRTERTHWWYQVRRAMIHDILRKYYPSRPHLSILDVGCGTGALLQELNQYGTVTGIDFSQKAVDFCKARGNTNVSVGSALSIPHPDNAFDVVLALDVIEHIENDRGAIAELYRVVKPGGIVVIFVPAFMFLWGVTDVRSQHYRRYTKPELRSKLKGQGFRIVRTSYFNTFLFPLIATLRLTVRALGIKMESENELGNPFIDSIFRNIFLFESKLLRHMNMPFGVSTLAISTKK